MISCLSLYIILISVNACSSQQTTISPDTSTIPSQDQFPMTQLVIVIGVPVVVVGVLVLWEKSIMRKGTNEAFWRPREIALLCLY